jgi:hypothetical protein
LRFIPPAKKTRSRSGSSSRANSVSEGSLELYGSAKKITTARRRAEKPRFFRTNATRCINRSNRRLSLRALRVSARSVLSICLPGIASNHPPQACANRACNSRIMNTCTKTGEGVGAFLARNSTPFREEATSSPQTSTILREKAISSPRTSWASGGGCRTLSRVRFFHASRGLPRHPQRFDPNYSTQTRATGWAERGNIRR